MRLQAGGEEKLTAESLQSFIDRADATKVQKPRAAGSKTRQLKKKQQRAGSFGCFPARCWFEAHNHRSLSLRGDRHCVLDARRGRPADRLVCGWGGLLRFF